MADDSRPGDARPARAMIDDRWPAEVLRAELHAILIRSGTEVDELVVGSVMSAGANRTTVVVELIGGSRVGGGPAPATTAVAQLTWPRTTATPTLAVADEEALLRLVRASSVPVAPVLAGGFSPVLEAEVLITRFVEGETVPRRVLRALEQQPDGGAQLTADCGRALAQLHQIEADQVRAAAPGLDRFGHIDLAAEYRSYLRQLLDGLPEPYPTLRYGLYRLGRMVLEPPHRPTLVHGDFRNGNLIVDRGRLAAIVDWELAHLGDPMEDLAWLCLRTWRQGQDEREVGGFGKLAQLRHHYEDRGGQWRPRAFAWWTVARTLWWGIGLAGQAARFMAGDSPSIVHAASGRRVVELEYDLLTLLDEIG